MKTTAVKAEGSAMPETNERLKLMFERMPTDSLIGHSVRLMEKRQALEAEEAVALSVLALRFTGDKTDEQIVTPFGVACRKVDNDWFVPEDKRALLKEVMGTEFNEYFEEKTRVKVLSGMEDLIFNLIGSKHPNYFKIETATKILPNLRAKVDLPVPQPGEYETEGVRKPQAAKAHKDLYKKIGRFVRVNTKVKVWIKPPQSEEANGKKRSKA